MTQDRGEAPLGENVYFSRGEFSLETLPIFHPEKPEATPFAFLFGSIFQVSLNAISEIVEIEAVEREEIILHDTVNRLLRSHTTVTPKRWSVLTELFLPEENEPWIRLRTSGINRQNLPVGKHQPFKALQS